MFWGITLESGKKYTQVLQKSFCVTMAALGFENPSNDCVYVVAEVNKAQHVLCSLQSGKLPQQVLNLNFTEGELVSFFIEGEGEVHLTGYLAPEDNDSDLSDESSCDEDDKDELKGDFELQNKAVKVVPSNYVHKYGINEDKVSEVSWQGILSGTQEESEKFNGEKDLKNKIRTKESKEVQVESTIERPTYEKKMETSGISPINNVVTENEKSVLNPDGDISNKSCSNNIGENIVYSEESDTKYQLVGSDVYERERKRKLKAKKRPTKRKTAVVTKQESAKRIKTRVCKKRKCNGAKSK